MTRKYFGTDGIRGLVGESPITPDFMVRLGYAAGEVLVRRAHLSPGQRPAVLIGKDTRISGYMLEASLEAGFAAAGVDVMLSGPMPTPAVAYLTRALRLQAGVVISASHNPYPDNGIKFFSGDGNKLPDAVEAEIEAQLELPMRCRASADLGKARRIDDAAGRYIEFCKSTFPNKRDLRGLKIVVDCANGAAYHIAPHVFHELGADVVAIGVNPDGLNINDMVGATSPKALQLAVKQHKADLGIAVDGDGDRLLMVDQRGNSYDGDQLLYVIARMRARQGAVPGVVGTLMSNLALQRALEAEGIAFERARVGDRYVLELLQAKGWQLGGENSGHIICLDKHTTGDALVSALQVLTAVRESDATLPELCRGLTLYPQKLVNVKVGKGFSWEANAAVGKAKEAAERELGKAGRVLLRPSGTEPVLRVMVEGEDGAKVETLAALLAESVRAAAQA
ncbi:MAG: phosphoglucosamine mutase [Burkholderiales bacterium]|nr:phosphoglucosamine mutase [Burkholderiales bacterium]